jgi:hypothetical protein
LAIGGHQGVASLGLVLASGVGGVLFAALIVLPAAVTVFWSGERPADLQNAAPAEPASVFTASKSA